MKIAIGGGGPAGLYLAAAIKSRCPAFDVTVFERRARGDTYGWGVVFSRGTMEMVEADDPVTASLLMSDLVQWDTIETTYRGERRATAGHPFFGMDRCRLLDSLVERCTGLGVRLAWETALEPVDRLLDEYDLVVGADGANSQLRAALADRLGVTARPRSNTYVWVGTPRRFDTFQFFFEETPDGWIWAHAYPYADRASTFIVESSTTVWAALGLSDLDGRALCARLGELFADHLGGEEIWPGSDPRGAQSGRSFHLVECEQWSHGNVVLIGDAAHGLHFSIGSGTRQAFEDAISLAEALREAESIPDALQHYERVRREASERLRVKAERSMRWFEEMPRYAALSPTEFEASLMNRARGDSPAT